MTLLQWTRILEKKIGAVVLVLLIFTLLPSSDITTVAAVAAAEAAIEGEEATATASATTQPTEEFFYLCSSGHLSNNNGNADESDKSNNDTNELEEKFRTILVNNPSYVNSRTNSGETCLHLTGIHGNVIVTKLLLETGIADVNIRTTYDKGLRMHPLSWNVYGGHFENIQLLLQHDDTDINLDFDSMKSSLSSSSTSSPDAVTSLDVLLEIIQNEGPSNNERFQKIYELFQKYNAKTMKEVLQERKQKDDDDGDDDTKSNSNRNTEGNEL